MNKQLDLISVIVPVYNVEKYIARCVNSIINQTYKNLEIILIDDGSTDNSRKICDDFSQKDSRIRVVHKDNEGPSIAKNLGIQLSSADLITFVDSDDWITPDSCEILYNNMIKTDANISCAALSVITENGKIISDSTKNNGMNDGEMIVFEDLNVIKEFFKQKRIKNFAWKLYKKSFICDFPIGVTYEDIMYSFNVFSNAKRVVYTNSVCYFYLKRKNGSITATLSEQNLIDFAQAFFLRYQEANIQYPLLSEYNIYAFLESTIALSTKNIITNKKYLDVDKFVSKFINIIIDYSNKHETRLLPLLNDYQKSCLYLMRYDLNLYYNFLYEREMKKRKYLDD